MKINKLLTVLLTGFVLLISLTTHAVNINDANWYLSLDVKEVQRNEVFKIIPFNKISEHINEKFPQEISHIVLYGDSNESEDATAIISGDFTTFSIAQYFLDLTESKGFLDEFTQNLIQYHGHEVMEIKSSDNRYSVEGEKQVYFSKIDNDLYIISFKLEEVKNWIDNKYSKLDINNDSLFSVKVDVESAMAHLGINLDKSNRHMMHSKIFKNVTQVSVSLTESNQDVVLDIALSTVDDTTASQIEQIISGLIAMSNLSGANDRNPLHAMVMQNLKIQRDENNIFINTYAPLDELVELNNKKYQLQDKNDE